MKQIIILIIACNSLQLSAQTMWYEGGNGDGNSLVYLENFTPQLIPIFFPYIGGKADGHGIDLLSNFQPVLVNNHYPYTGGIADGHAQDANSNFQPTLVNNHFPYLGGKGDGWSNALNQSYVLPLVLLSFEGEALNDKNKLRWVTSKEENVDYFQVEKSKDAINFTDIGQVQAVGNSVVEQSYTFDDTKDVQGVHYYQLKMTDIDTKYTYSHIIKLINSAKAYSIILAPNPARNQISIRLSKALNASTQFAVFDLKGQAIIKSVISKDEAVKTINISELASGQYIIYLKTPDENISLPFIKQ